MKETVAKKPRSSNSAAWSAGSRRGGNALGRRRRM